MSFRPLRLSPLAVGVAFAFGGCGGDGLPTGSNSGDQLAAAEVEELVVELFDLFGSIDIDIPGLQVTNPRLFLSRAGVPINENFSGTDQCDGGGTTSISGSVSGDVDEETGVGEVSLEGTLDFTNCHVHGETAEYTINGDPEIGVNADFDIGPESASIRINIGGGIAFTTDDDRSGTCALDLSVTFTFSGLTFSESVSGSACGINASNFDTEFDFGD